MSLTSLAVDLTKTWFKSSRDLSQSDLIRTVPVITVQLLGLRSQRLASIFVVACE